MGAHEVRPARLEITQLDAHTYRTIWKLPTRGDAAIHLVPHLSNGWLDRDPTDQYAADGFLIRTWVTRELNSEPLAGATLSIEGLPYTITDVLVSIEVLGVEPIRAVLRPDQPQWRVSLASTDDRTTSALLTLGIRHILTGPDHLLFVFGLLLIVRDRWKLLKTVSAFTLAHSITLAAVVLGKVSLYPPFVETMIALSILFLAPEIIRARNGGTSLTIRFPWAVAFVFGSFHGMGFAGALTELGLKGRELFTALALFNVGVEVGQVLFIALVLLAAKTLPTQRPVPALPAYIVGVAGAYWFTQCCATLFGVT